MGPMFDEDDIREMREHSARFYAAQAAPKITKDANQRMKELYDVIEKATEIANKAKAVINENLKIQIDKEKKIIDHAIEIAKPLVIDATKNKGYRWTSEEGSETIRATPEGVHIEWYFHDEYNGGTKSTHFFPWNDLIQFEDTK